MIEEADLQLRSHLQTANGGPGAIHLNGARQSSADRSLSATSSQNGEDHQDLEDDIVGVVCQQTRDSHGGGLDLNREVSDLKNSFIYVSHQLNRIMKQMNVTPCPCGPCQARHRQMNGIKPDELSHSISTPSHMSLNSIVKARPPQPSQPSFVSNNIGQQYANHPGGGKLMIGPAEKKLVAEYARTHGAVAAARKFGVPPPVSTYYQRKDSATSGIHPQLTSHQTITVTSQPAMHPQSTPSTPTLSNNLAGSPGPSSEGESESNDKRDSGPPILQPATTPNHPPHTPQSVPPSPLFNIHNPQSMMEMMKMNAAHSTGSPGFLRGRGRGRPKLIGDELDADLVDYMVTYKQQEPNQHLTASAALAVARSYILEKAPGLLEEQGGHVKLKLTWAMKLVSRIAERQKEIELGLPAGSLSNMGRVHLNNLPGGNFMADMMAQNILSQHMIIGGLNGSNGNSKQGDQPSAQENEEPVMGAPEILNVKELPLNFLNDLMAAAGHHGEGLIEGQLPEHDEKDDEMAN